jgi:hypothetical protein
LIDITPSEGRFTWTNKRGGKHHIAEILDRFLVSEAFFQTRQAIAGDIFHFYGSDHWPISLKWIDDICPLPKPFRFEKFWTDTQNLCKNVKWWKEDQNMYGTKMYQFQQKLRHIKACLRKWNKEVFGNIQEEKINFGGGDGAGAGPNYLGGLSLELQQQETHLRLELDERDQQEEIMFHQKYCILWLKEGDKNIKFSIIPF